MTNKEALARFKGDLEMMEMVSSHKTKQMEMYEIAVEALSKIEGFQLLLDWAIECGFGYDNISNEYEIYKNEIKDMDYTEGLIYIATKEAAKND